MLLASDENNKEFLGSKNPDAALQVAFYQRTEPHNFNVRMNIEHKLCDTANECEHTAYLKGKTFPLPESVTDDWIHISMPGRTDTDIHEPVREDHRKRFPRQWDKYVSNMSEAEQFAGTKLSEWKIDDKLVLSTHQVESLKSQRFYTVEQIANCSDGQLQALGMNANMLRQKARGTVLQKMGGDTLAAKEKEIAELKASMAQMIQDAVKQAMQAQLPAASPKKKPGRPPKVKHGTDAAATSQPSAG